MEDSPKGTFKKIKSLFFISLLIIGRNVSLSISNQLISLSNRADIENVDKKEKTGKYILLISPLNLSRMAWHEILNKAVALDPKDMKTQILVYELEKELGDMTAEQKLAQIAESEDISIK